MRILKLDKRLARRRGWLAEGELATALDALPDVAEKAEVVRDDDESAAPKPPTAS